MVEEITPTELHERLRSDEEVQVVDVRSPCSFDRGHIPGAENVPFARFVETIEEQEWEDFVVVVCPHGESSLQAARLLEAYEGLEDDATVANLVGGLTDWEYDLESTDGPPADESRHEAPF